MDELSARGVHTRGNLVKVDMRKLGIWMVASVASAMRSASSRDAVRQADDRRCVAREGIFDLSGFPHALFFGGALRGRPRTVPAAVRHRRSTSRAAT